MIMMPMVTAVHFPFAGVMPDSRFVRGMIEMDYLVAEDVDVDHAADLVWKFCEVAASGLRPTIAGKRKVSEFLRSGGQGFWNCCFLFLLSLVQYDRARD